MGKGLRIRVKGPAEVEKHAFVVEPMSNFPQIGLQQPGNRNRQSGPLK